MSNLPLFNMLYIAKEALVGFERLFDQFGSFELNSKMIFISRLGKCKVWCHENISKNSPMKLTKTTETEFKNNIVRVLE